LPQYLPERIVVDISSLKEIGNAIYVRDLPALENVTILNRPDEMIVIASATKEEAVVEAAPVAEVAEEPEVIEKGKKEEEVPEEGTKSDKPGEKPEKPTAKPENKIDGYIRTGQKQLPSPDLITQFFEALARRMALFKLPLISLVR